MSRFFSFNLKIKIIILVSFPISAIFFYLMSELYGTYFLFTQDTKLQNQISISHNISKLIHELQKERGMSAGLLSSHGKIFNEELEKQREKTDKSYQNLLNSIEANQNNYFFLIQKGIDKLENLSLVRQNISKKASDNPTQNLKLLEYYTQLIETLLDDFLHTAKLFENPNISKETLAYIYFLYAKEYTGLERATANMIFITNKNINNEFYNYFLSLITKQEVYVELFKSLTSLDNIDFYTQISKDAYFEKVKNFREIIIQQHENGFYNIDAKTWFEVITHKINLLKKVEDQIANQLIKNMQEELNKRKRQLVILLITEVLLIVVLFTLFALLIRELEAKKEAKD